MMKKLSTAVLLCFCLFQFSFGQVIEETFDNLGPTELSNEIQEQEPKTTIKFEELSYDFGTIGTGEKVSYVFKFENVGEIPLVLIEVKGGCGCTVPFYPKEPIMPGESSEIEVLFDSKNKAGQQSKRVTITANTEPAQTYLSIRGEVVKDALVTQKLEEELIKRNEVQADLQSFDKSCFAIYPNPTHDFIQLELKEYIGKSANIEIRNEMGQSMLSQKVEQISRESTRFDVSTFTPGMYLISIVVGKEKPMTQCFIVSGT